MSMEEINEAVTHVNLPHTLLQEVRNHTESAMLLVDAGRQSPALAETLGHLSFALDTIGRAQEALARGQSEIDAFAAGLAIGGSESVHYQALPNHSGVPAGELYIIDRKIGTNPVRVAACSHTLLNGPYVTEALADCEIIAIEAPGTVSDKQRVAESIEYSQLLSKGLWRNSAARKLDAKEGIIGQYLKPFIKSNKGVILIDIPQSHPDWPIAEAYIKELSAFQGAIGRFTPPANAREILRRGLPTYSASLKVRRNVIYDQLRAIAGAVPGASIGVITGVHHYDVADMLPTEDGTPAEPLEGPMVHGRPHDVMRRLIAVYDNGDDIPDALLDREVLATYLDIFVFRPAVGEQLVPRTDAEAKYLKVDIYYKAHTVAQKLVLTLTDEKIAACLAEIEAAGKTKDLRTVATKARSLVRRYPPGASNKADKR